MAPGDNRSSHPRVAALAATLLSLGPSTVWAHGGTPHEGATTGLTPLWAFLFVAVLLPIWITRRLRFQPRLRSLRLEVGRGVPWAVIGLLSVHLIALPPHLVHHLAGPPDEGVKCILFVQGSTSDQERAEPIPLVVSPFLAGTMADYPAPPVLFCPIPVPSGRSPPGLWI
jgi:hypothetical protein